MSAKTDTGQSTACYTNGAQYASIDVAFTGGTATIKFQCQVDGSTAARDFTDNNGTLISTSTSGYVFTMASMGCKWIYAYVTAVSGASITGVCNACF